MDAQVSCIQLDCSYLYDRLGFRKGGGCGRHSPPVGWASADVPCGRPSGPDCTAADRQKPHASHACCFNFLAPIGKH